MVSIVQKLWEKLGLISLIVFEKKRAMDFVILASLKHMNISAQLSLHFGESCKVLACTTDLLWIFKILNFNITINRGGEKRIHKNYNFLTI